MAKLVAAFREAFGAIDRWLDTREGSLSIESRLGFLEEAVDPVRSTKRARESRDFASRSCRDWLGTSSRWSRS
jgi:hypothetical protein